jgi:hypothetical protein
MFINILKIRIVSLYPQMSRDIIRNEAHVRLATSVWYASTSLLWLASIVVGVVGGAVVWCQGAPNGTASMLFGPASYALLLLFFCVVMRHHLRKCIHYMRVREVIYVLEAAHLAEDVGGKKLFVDLLDKDHSHKCEQCAQIGGDLPPDGSRCCQAQAAQIGHG